MYKDKVAMRGINTAPDASASMSGLALSRSHVRTAIPVRTSSLAWLLDIRTQLEDCIDETPTPAQSSSVWPDDGNRHACHRPANRSRGTLPADQSCFGHCGTGHFDRSGAEKPLGHVRKRHKSFLGFEPEYQYSYALYGDE